MMPTPMGADMMIKLSGNPALRASTLIPHGGRIIQIDARHLIASIAARLCKERGGGMGLLAAVGGGEQQHCKMKTSVRWTYKNYTPDLTPGTGSVDRQYKSDLC